jgi:hypothetical protein
MERRRGPSLSLFVSDDTGMTTPPGPGRLLVPAPRGDGTPTTVLDVSLTALCNRHGPLESAQARSASRAPQRSSPCLSLAAQRSVRVAPILLFALILHLLAARPWTWSATSGWPLAEWHPSGARRQWAAHRHWRDRVLVSS